MMPKIILIWYSTNGSRLGNEEYGTKSGNMRSPRVARSYRTGYSKQANAVLVANNAKALRGKEAKTYSS